MAPSPWSYCAQLVKDADPDRFLTTLFMAKEKREDLFALLAFNVEVSKTAEVVTQALPGQIRLTWWREALDQVYACDGALTRVRNHEVVKALVPVCPQIDRSLMDTLIEVRLKDLDREPLADLSALEEYCAGSGGGLLRAYGRVLEKEQTPDSERQLNHLGVAWALIGLARSRPYTKRLNAQLLPDGMETEDLCALAHTHIQKAGKPDGKPAKLFACLAKTYLQAFAQTKYDPKHAYVQTQPPGLTLKLWWKNVFG